MKKFKLWDGQAHDLQTAATLGWDDRGSGISTLDAMDVGETTFDDDDDTWERIE